MTITGSAASRHRVCCAVAGLLKNASYDEASVQLGGFLASVAEASPCTGDGVTPLMVACDKNQPGCINFMINNPSPLWGKVDDHSSDGCGGNTALHHAAMSGCVEAIQLFSGGLLELLKKTNVHKDTPVMMACAFNQLHFLENLRDTLGAEELLHLLNTKNDSLQTPMSLAFGHGHDQVVKFLLSVGVQATYELIQECKRDLEKMDGILLRAGDRGKGFDNQRLKVKRCLVILELALAEESRAAAEDLVRQENDATKEAKYQEATGVSRRKKLGKSRPKMAAVPIIDDDTLSECSPHKAWSKGQEKASANEHLSQPRFRTMPDGTLIGKSSLLDHLVTDEANGQLCNTKESRSVNELLRERLREPTFHDDAIDAVMDSLCLDASMLLYTSHGMAMNLSPSQLEAIKKILEKQVKSVAEAKSIQERIRGKV